MLRRLTGIGLLVGSVAAFTTGTIGLLTATEFTSGTAMAALAAVMGAPMSLFGLTLTD